MKAVILAAGLGTRLEPITNSIPKCMVPVAGMPLIDRIITRVAEAGIDELVVVTGYLHEVLASHLAGSANELARSATLVRNQRYADWGNFYSLLVARDALGDSDFVRIDGDLLLDAGILPALLATPGPAALAIDHRDDLDDEDMKVRLDPSGRIIELSKRIDPALAYGEAIGADRISRELSPDVFAELAAMIDDGLTHEYYEFGYERLMKRGVHFACADITGALWCEIDNAEDLERAGEVVRRQPDGLR